MEYERVEECVCAEEQHAGGDEAEYAYPASALPRVGEIVTDVDSNPKAYYFQQTENGMYTRMAIISYLLGVVK